jgi:outer membrane protein TolC
MLKRRRIHLIAWILMLPLVGSCAAPPETVPPSVRPAPAIESIDPEPVELPEVFDLDTCIRFALEHNARSGIANPDVEIAEARLSEARSAYWPDLKLGSRFRRLHDDPYMVTEGVSLDFGENTAAFADAIALAQLTNMGLAPNPGDPLFDAAYAMARQEALKGLKNSELPDVVTTLEDRNTWRTSLLLTWPLFTGGKISSANERAEIGVRAARRGREAAHHDMAFAVTRFYQARLLAGELVVIGEETLTRFETILDITERVYKTGSGTVDKTDYLKNRLFVSMIRGQVSVLVKNRDRVEAALRNAMGLPPDAPIRLKEDRLAASPREFREVELLAAAFDNRPDLKQVNLGIDAANSGITAAKSDYWPTLVAFGEASHLENDLDGGIVDWQEDAWAIGLSLDVSIFQGFRTDARVAQAKGELLKLTHQKQLLETGIRTQVRTEYLGYLAALDELRSAEDGLADARENRELNLRAYEAELVETEDVITAQLLETMTKIRHRKALFDLAVSAARLDLVAGRMPGVTAR